MKPLYQKYETAKADAILIFNLVALLAEAQAEMQAASLDRLCVRLVRPRISGALLLSTKNFAGNYIVLNDDEVAVHVAALPEGKNRLTVQAEYGTNTVTLAIVDIFTTANEVGVFEPEAIITPVVKQVCDGVGVTPAELAAALAPIENELAGKADGQIYRVGESGDPAVRDVAKVRAHSVELSAQAEATGLYAVAEGSGKATGAYSHAEGEDTLASGEGAHAEGKGGFGEPYEVTVRPLTQAEKREMQNKYGDLKMDYISEDDEIDNGTCPILYEDEECTIVAAEIVRCRYSSDWLSDSDVSGDFFAIESGTLQAGTYWARLEPRASGYCAHAEGNNTTASGYCAHAEGYETTASGGNAHAEGENTTASGYCAHAEGNSTTASGYCAHAEGNSTTASGDNAHAEGENTTASGGNAHAEGYETTASGYCAHAEGENTTASGYCQHVGGVYNVEDAGQNPWDKGEFAFIIGNGEDDDNRSNAIAIKWDGTLVMWNSGSRVELTPAKLAALLALV